MYTKRARGRPRKTDGTTRSEHISLRFTKEELRDVEDTAKILGMSLTDFIRSCAISRARGEDEQYHTEEDYWD